MKDSASVVRGLMIVESAKSEHRPSSAVWSVGESGVGGDFRREVKNWRIRYSMCAREADRRSCMCSFHASDLGFLADLKCQCAFKTRRWARARYISN
jgi:hypothetical protein